MITYDSNLKIFSSTLISDSNYFSGFSTKDVGDARKIESVVNFFQSNNINFKKIVIPEQIHSVNIVTFTNKDKEPIEKIEETDGVITKEDGIVLTVKTGDCSPIVFADKVNGVIGISHQGWRGSVKRMVQKMVERMVAAGSEIRNIKVAIGPSIGGCCYDIDEDRYYEFMEEFDGYSEKIFHSRGGKKYLNLALLNHLLLLEKGIRKENIDFFPFCTKCDKKRFFSFRRDKRNDYGEMVSFIVKGV